MEKTDGFDSKGNWSHFITLQGEKLLFVKRRHWFVIVPPVILVIAFSFVSLLLAIFVFLMFFPSMVLFVISMLFIISFTLCFIAKVFIDWFFRVYIITTRKLLEIYCIPLAQRQINDVLLDQVRCTEIDVHMDGIINELIDRGDVIVTFDRPTHEEEFVFADIQHSRKIATFLSNYMLQDHTGQRKTTPIWYRDRNDPRKARFSEELNI